ncbi:MAG: ATP-binding cassette domain-containing protein [Clostridiaceae bacterium]|nr:ATP-binding cassette domain-containing protein [Clostridiaceae bacterium]
MANIIEAINIKKYFQSPKGIVHAVDDINMVIETGTTMGVVGESGCGKTTLGRALAHMPGAEPTSGTLLFDGEDVTVLKGKTLKNYHEKVQYIFQDPYSSLDPRKTIHETVTEPLVNTGHYKGKGGKLELEERAHELMDLVGIDERLANSYPHELDGGRRQRVVIARALSLEPKFIVCDEPVSALDVSIQAQVLNLLQDLQEKKNLTYMFITHDMSVVRHISDNISVMYLGQLVETSNAKELFVKNYHPYTKALLSAIPSTDIYAQKQRIMMKGEITSPINPKPGCRFESRCPYAKEQCRQPQKLEEIVPGHFVACCRAQELNNEL